MKNGLTIRFADQPNKLIMQESNRVVIATFTKPEEITDSIVIDADSAVNATFIGLYLDPDTVEPETRVTVYEGYINDRNIIYITDNSLVDKGLCYGYIVYTNK
jgi:hypothetical protein